MRSFTPAAMALLVASVRADYFYEEPSQTTQIPECTATSSTGSGAFFDMRPDIAWPEDAGKAHKSALHKDYYSRGYDYGKNFTMNVCNSVVDPVTDVVGLEDGLWANISAYYVEDGKVYSIGSESQDLRSRGRKLYVQYTGGSPCGADAESESTLSRRNASPALIDDKTTADLEPDVMTKGDGVRRKSTIISFLCDRDPSTSQTSISFVGTDPDECAYFFDARSIHACPAAEPHKPGSVGPGSVFGLIVLIAVLVYLLGGIFYNRAVNNSRGWRQLPNYSLWAGMWSFITDIVIIALASCARLLPGRRGYRAVRSNLSARDIDQEAQRNALIDQLDENWDD